MLLPFRRCKGSKDSCPGLAAKFATCNSVRVNIVVIVVVVVVVSMKYLNIVIALTISFLVGMMTYLINTLVKYDFTKDPDVKEKNRYSYDMSSKTTLHGYVPLRQVIGLAHQEES